jgi:hypothetical protein
LEVGAAGDGDNQNHSFSAFRAARCPIHDILIHEILPIFTPNSELEVLFHSSVSAKLEDSMEATLVMPRSLSRSVVRRLHPDEER